jgi:hypothetical protein
VVPDAALTVAWSLLVGPDGLGLVQPAMLGPALPMLVSFALAMVFSILSDQRCHAA